MGIWNEHRIVFQLTVALRIESMDDWLIIVAQKDFFAIMYVISIGE